MMFGIVLHRNGWGIDYLGTNTPVSELKQVAAAARPDLVVLAATVPQSLEPVPEELTSVARCAPLALAGPGATAEIAIAVGARLMPGDPVTEAEQVARSW